MRRAHVFFTEKSSTNRFNHLQPVVILDRLVFRKYYGLAIHIAKYLKLQETRILEHWAFQKITHDKSRSLMLARLFLLLTDHCPLNALLCRR